jgi:hypothetical protein
MLAATPATAYVAQTLGWTFLIERLQVAYICVVLNSQGDLRYVVVV